MGGWHLGPMLAYDLETDSPDPQDARIVTACVAEIDGTGQHAPGVQSWILKPTRPIPDGAAEIHGYTTEKATAEGRDPIECITEIAVQLGEATAAGVPIVAFNAVYDFTVLDREMRRNSIGVIGPQHPGQMRVIDPFVLDKALDKYRKGKRTLTATCEHYGVRLDGAHDASFDAVAAARVAWRIAQRHPQIARLDLDELHAYQVAAKVEQDASLAAYFRRMARQQRDVDEQIALNAKAEGCTGAWPLIPFAPERQESLA
ncbi:3'-5' exonuclease [Actinomadura sp. KC216]|uniref:exonuclease domain-containing protein n=1 Tax=Actinomadura sp. KC216 TaxID=2530370 RepID=UPI00104F3B20|nr:exonuclease domain-containing protein [Actinomadura sp. KC216]TDB83424.1 3'-5' exonuclease [Actinomadura sp. KC216]